MPDHGCSQQQHGCGRTERFRSVSDNAGNTETSNTINVKVDKTKPTISGSASPTVPDGSNGWYKTAPTVTFNCGDALSGIASCVVDGSSPASSSVTLSESDTAQAVSGTATDNAGNSEIDSVTGLKIDLSNPAVPTWGSGGISDGEATTSALFQPPRRAHPQM